MKKNKKVDSDIDYLFNNGVDFKNRILYLTDHSSCDDGQVSLNYNNIIKSILYLSKLDSSKNIYIIINSFGGDVYESLSIVDSLSYIPNKVIGVGIGLVASGASLILASCKERHLTNNSFIMMHELSSSIEGKHTDQKIEVIHQDNILANMCKIYNKAIDKLSFEQIKELLKKDYYMTPEEALKFKFIKSIINDKSSFNKVFKG